MSSWKQFCLQDKIFRLNQNIVTLCKQGRFLKAALHLSSVALERAFHILKNDPDNVSNAIELYYGKCRFQHSWSLTNTV